MSNVYVCLTVSPLWTVPGTAANEDWPCTSHGPPIGWSQNSSVATFSVVAVTPAMPMSGHSENDTGWRRHEMAAPTSRSRSAVFRDNSGARNRSGTRFCWNKERGGGGNF